MKEIDEGWPQSIDGISLGWLHWLMWWVMAGGPLPRNHFIQKKMTFFLISASLVIAFFLCSAPASPHSSSLLINGRERKAWRERWRKRRKSLICWRAGVKTYNQPLRNLKRKVFFSMKQAALSFIKSNIPSLQTKKKCFLLIHEMELNELKDIITVIRLILSITKTIAEINEWNELMEAFVERNRWN